MGVSEPSDTRAEPRLQTHARTHTPAERSKTDRAKKKETHPAASSSSASCFARTALTALMGFRATLSRPCASSICRRPPRTPQRQSPQRFHSPTTKSSAVFVISQYPRANEPESSVTEADGNGKGGTCGGSRLRCARAPLRGRCLSGEWVGPRNNTRRRVLTSRFEVGRRRFA